MAVDPSAITNAYLEHLSADDLAMLVPKGQEPLGRARQREFFYSHPGCLDEVLGASGTFQAVFAGDNSGDPLLRASPFLVFALCVHRASVELRSATYVSEWLGPGRHAPVFDVDQLREFMSHPWRRLFLVELLASYTHVASGSVVFFTRRGLRRQRFSELDPVRLAGLLDVVSDAERPGVYRRLGDLALFLTGVFPDHVARRGFGPVEEGRLLRSGGIAGAGAAAVRAGADARLEKSGPALSGDAGAVGLLEWLGRRWYRAAFDLLPRPAPENVAVLGELSERFGHARRILSLVTDRFLFDRRALWFGFSPQ